MDMDMRRYLNNIKTTSNTNNEQISTNEIIYTNCQGLDQLCKQSYQKINPIKQKIQIDIDKLMNNFTDEIQQTLQYSMKESLKNYQEAKEIKDLRENIKQISQKIQKIKTEIDPQIQQIKKLDYQFDCLQQVKKQMEQNIESNEDLRQNFQTQKEQINELIEQYKRQTYEIQKNDIQKFTDKLHELNNYKTQLSQLFQETQESGIQCPICLDYNAEQVMVPCGHMFCTKCIEMHYSNINQRLTNHSHCPICRKRIMRIVKTFMQRSFE